MTRHHNGFTLVELSLAMTFISVLLLSVAFLTLQISSIYNKGITLRDVNQVGQLVTSDVQRTLNASNQQEVITDKVFNNGGRICAGSTVYAWNTGKFLDTNNGFNKYADGHTANMRLVKFQANGKDYCVDGPSGYEPVPVDAAELITNGGRDLAIQGFTVDTPLALDGNQKLYNVHITIGTNTTEVINGLKCEAPTSSTDDEYCAINQFNFVARAGNSENE